MASIDSYVTKTGKVMYRVRIQRKGSKTLTAVFPTLAQARKYGTMIEGDIIVGRHFPVKSTHTLTELLERYTADIRPRSPRRPLSITRHRHLLTYHGTAMSYEDLRQVF